MKMLLGLLLLVSSFVNAAVIDFDALPGGGTLANNSALDHQYASFGVTFGATENGNAVTSSVINSFDPYQGNYWANTRDEFFDLDSRHDVMNITFSSGANNVSWLTNSFPYDFSAAIIFNAYDQNSNLLETVMAEGAWVLTSFAAAGIYRIEAIQPDDDWGWAMDNLSFSLPSEVPEPGTAALLGLGLLWFAAARRRKT